MVKLDDILKKAHSYFSASKYDKALFLYGQVLSYDPDNIEYQLYSIISDLGYENDQKAQSLFDYFTVAKEENFDEAVKYVNDIIAAHDGDNSKMIDILKDLSNSSVESLNAIEYDDFMDLVNSRGSFKEAYQDIMFSTKVAIRSKEELVDFIDLLIENNFDTTAYDYLDGFTEFFTYDTELNKLYEKLGQKNSDNKLQQ